jgi:hypothetical protein
LAVGQCRGLSVKVVNLALVAIVGASLTGCATITRGTKDAWSVSSEPSGARVETSNGFFCQATPCAMKMPRKAQFVATVTKAGYKPATITVTHKVSNGGGAGMAGNVLLGGLIGVAVDGTSGAMLDLVPNPAFVKLEPELAAPAAAAVAPPPPVVTAPQPVQGSQPAPAKASAAADASPTPPKPRRKRCSVSSPDNPDAVSC